MINQQELAEAIETISEGGQALGVSSEHVYLCMLQDKEFSIMMMADMHSLGCCVKFNKKFNDTAKLLLLEALRAKQEVENGLL